tara:strand:- start:1297 stop:1773 length:477 start_codon:yes stop_codon:yes gene_type:complete
MNKILNKTLILFFIFGITSCSYKPIFLEKDYDFEIKEVLPRGDKNINRIIESKLNFIKSSNENKKKRYTIEINSSKNREIVSKDSKGDPLKFELNILVEYKIMNNNDLLLNNKIEKNNVYNNNSDQFELEQKEEIILENLSKSIGDTIISSIINLNDN